MWVVNQMAIVKGGDVSRNKLLAYEVYFLVFVMEGANEMIEAFPLRKNKKLAPSMTSTRKYTSYANGFFQLTSPPLTVAI